MRGKGRAKTEGRVAGAETSLLIGGSGFWGVRVSGPDGDGQEAPSLQESWRS